MAKKILTHLSQRSVKCKGSSEDERKTHDTIVRFFATKRIFLAPQGRVICLFKTIRPAGKSGSRKAAAGKGGRKRAKR